MYPTPQFEKGFFGSLFDFSFTSLITTRIIRVLYALAVVLFSIGAVILMISGIASGRAGGFIFAILIVPLAYFFYLVTTRIWMEFLIVVFRIGDDINAIRRGGGGLSPRGPAPGGPFPSGPPPSGPPPSGPNPGPLAPGGPVSPGGPFQSGPVPSGPPVGPPPAPSWPPRPS
jgi:Domain of unknown function (DUF4282)